MKLDEVMRFVHSSLSSNTLRGLHLILNCHPTPVEDLFPVIRAMATILADQSCVMGCICIFFLKLDLYKDVEELVDPFGRAWPEFAETVCKYDKWADKCWLTGEFDVQRVPAVRATVKVERGPPEDDHILHIEIYRNDGVKYVTTPWTEVRYHYRRTQNLLIVL